MTWTIQSAGHEFFLVVEMLHVFVTRFMTFLFGSRDNVVSLLGSLDD